MNRMSTLPPSVAPAQPLNMPGAAGPTFIAFAAQRPLKAVERAFAEDADKFHGVFTWTLMQGLQGAAVDGFGMVTGRSLADWLRNAQRSNMDKRDLEDPDVAEEPGSPGRTAGSFSHAGFRRRPIRSISVPGNGDRRRSAPVVRPATAG